MAETTRETTTERQDLYARLKEIEAMAPGACLQMGISAALRDYEAAVTPKEEELPSATPAKVVRLTRAELEALGEYSCSLPTLTTIGKRWARNETAFNQMWGRPPEPERWVMGEYVDIGDPDKVGIRWTPIEIVEPPALARLREPAGGTEVAR
jgi:hypothetical protein